MPENKKLQSLTKIVKIRSLEKAMAQQALMDAFQFEEKRLSEKEKSEQALFNSHEKWESHLSESSMITEHLKYYADDLVSHMNHHEVVEERYDRAVLETEEKAVSLKISDAIAEKTNELHSKLRRQIIQKKEERALTAFEERFAFMWGRKI